MKSAGIKTTSIGKSAYIKGSYCESTCTGAASIRNTYIRSFGTIDTYTKGAYFWGTSIRDTCTRGVSIKDIYIKNTFFWTSCIKNIYVKGINAFKHFEI